MDEAPQRQEFSSKEAVFSTKLSALYIMSLYFSVVVFSVLLKGSVQTGVFFKQTVIIGLVSQILRFAS